MAEIVLIVGSGPGLSSSIAKACYKDGMKVVLSSRDTSKLSVIKRETNAITINCDASNIDNVEKLFAEVDKIGIPNLVVYNPSMRIKGSITELDPKKKTQDAINVTCFGAFLVAQEAANECYKGVVVVYFLQVHLPE